ncbi:MAG TPA: molybdopterin-dependent oxidoreductase, partial [Pseudohaliea sp.]|nr:molybdopterin-dependent oxidoreductase [Pseudohaliea sp.]
MALDTQEPGTGDASPTAAVCPLDCADTCSLSVERTGGEVLRVRGGHGNTFTRGRICAKVARAMPAQVHGPDRLTRPLLRDGPRGAGAFRPCSWDEALDRVHEGFERVRRRFGAEAIAPLYYGGPMGLLANGSMDKRFFHRLGASRVDASPLCAGVSSAAWESVFGDAGGIPFTELAAARMIVVWGNNITTCNLHLTNVIRDARRRGAKLVVIDPKRTRIARDADLHLPLFPGTDVVLGYAVAAELERLGGLDRAFIDRHVLGADRYLAAAREFPVARAAALCGLAAGDIERFARWWRELAPVAMTVGVAPERNRNGGAGLRTAYALPALTGNFGPPGAGICEVSGFFPVNEDALARPDLAPASLRELNVLDIPRLVLEPGKETPLRALFIYNHNPVAVHPEARTMQAALAHEALFLVGAELTLTDSLACADVILPAASHFEYEDLYTAYGHHYLQRSAPVIPPVGEALPNTELFRRLAARFGFDEPCFGDSDEALMDQALDRDHPALAGRPPSALAPGEAIDMGATPAPSVIRDRPPATASGRIELWSATLDAGAGEGLPRFRPLLDPRRFILVSPASEQRINSTYGNLPRQAGDLACEMHPEDARSLALTDGSTVCLYNAQGEVHLPLAVTDAVRPGTVFVPKG